MKSLLEQVDEVDYLIRQLCKIDSKMHAGQFIDAWRENRRIIAALEKTKRDLIASGEVIAVAEVEEAH